MSKRLRVDDSDTLTHLKEFPLYNVIDKHVQDGLNKLKTEEKVIQGKQESVRQLKIHIEQGTLPKSFPSISFLSVGDEFKAEADSVIDTQLKPALVQVLHGLTNIRQKELDRAKEKKASIASEWFIELENKLQFYVGQGALDQEEKAIWSAQFKDCLDKRESKQRKILNQKWAIMLEKKAKALEKKKEREAQAQMDRVMDVDTGLADVVKRLQKEVADLKRQKQPPRRMSLKGLSQQKKSRLPQAGTKQGRDNVRKTSFRAKDGRKKPANQQANRQDRAEEIGRRRANSDLQGRESGNHKPRPGSTRSMSLLGLTRNPSRPKRN